MIGIGDHEYVAIRLAAFADEVLGPAVHPVHAPLELAVFQTTEPISLARAQAAEYTPVGTGFRWGPVWSTAWFRIRGRVPAKLAGHPVALRFSSGTEALLWQDGAPRQGFDANRDSCLVFDPARGGEQLELYVEAACNHPFGATTFFWDPPEVHRRWSEAEPGRVECCELVAVDPRMDRLRHKLHFAREVALALPPESARAHTLVRGLRELLSRASAAEPRALASLEPQLDALIHGAKVPAATTCVAVGHAHIDTAWLWPLRETKRKLLRSWANALELMERFPRFRFIGSQAQHYTFVEADSPELFTRIRARVDEGRWEPGGAMWVEPDCNAPSGESLVRQILYGTRYFHEKFGDAAAQRHLYLPDTFGFPASLPQIMRLAGLDTFVTNKLCWSERNDFPHTTFRWRGIDGTEVLTHFTPGDDYNAQLTPAELRAGEQRLIRKDLREVMQARCTLTRWLQPYGFGDGGGGPTAEAVARADLATDAEGMPRVEHGRLVDFCAQLHEERAAARAAEDRDLPVWDGELYLEKHRGTLTSAAWLKRANAEAERRLRVIEAVLAGCHDRSLFARLLPRLLSSWHIVLLHQFHDILPGSSIAAVYDEARDAYAELRGELDRLFDEVFDELGTRLGDGGATQPVLVFNPCSEPRSGVVSAAGVARLVADVPPLGAVVIDADAAAPSPPTPVEVTERRLANEHLELELDDAGRVAALRRTDTDVPVNAGAAGGGLLPLNQLCAYEDRPRRWEAWDIDFDYTDKPELLSDAPDSMSVSEQAPERGVITAVRTFRNSRIVQRYVLDATSRHVAVETEVDWQEERTFLRALFPTRVRARHATFGIQFGHIERPTHRNTSWDEARFEVCGHRWMDLSQPGLGLAVLDDGKYGRSSEGGTLGLSLLRSPNWPAAGLDRGTHRFTYALMPHAGDWRRARVPAVADEVAEALIAVPLSAPADAGPTSRQPFELKAPEPGRVQIAAFKPAEDGDGSILRLCERHGGRCPVELHWAVPAAIVSPVDLCERPLDRGVEHDADTRCTRFTLGPFEILSLRVTADTAGTAERA